MQQNNIYRGNSVISVETLPEYSHPVVIKKPSKRHPSRRSLRSLEKEYEKSLRTTTAVSLEMNPSVDDFVKSRK